MMSGSMVIVHAPISFIQFFCGLLGGGGGASLRVDVLAQYLSKKAPDIHFWRDRSSEAASTPLYHMLMSCSTAAQYDMGAHRTLRL